MIDESNELNDVTSASKKALTWRLHWSPVTPVKSPTSIVDCNVETVLSSQFLEFSTHETENCCSLEDAIDQMNGPTSVSNDAFIDDDDSDDEHYSVNGEARTPLPANEENVCPAELRYIDSPLSSIVETKRPSSKNKTPYSCTGMRRGVQTIGWRVHINVMTMSLALWDMTKFNRSYTKINPGSPQHMHFLGSNRPLCPADMLA